MRSLLLLALAACAPEAVDVAAPASAPAVGAVEAEAALQGDPFEVAGETWEVPSDLLRAIALTETGMQPVVGIEGHDGRPAAYGLMALRGQRLLDAAELAGLSPELVRTRPLPNVSAAAALLSTWADEADIDRSELAAWGPVVARYGDMADEAAQAEYVWRGVYRVLHDGYALEGHRIKAYGVDPAFPEPEPARAYVGPNYAASVWRASPNYDGRNGGAGGIGMVIIHTCEGAYSGCWSWLTNPASGVSSHYVVNETGGEVSQLVDEANRAWHVGATYDCGLNGNTDCSRSGWNVNHFSVGIEHAGYASYTSWNNGLLDASAQLVCDVTRDRGIPRDSYHIVAHGRLQPYNRSDPGSGWPWTDYINRVNAFCNGGVVIPPVDPNPPGSFVIDSNNTLNDTARYSVEVSGNWTASVNVAGYYNTGYWVAPTAAVNDPAHFWFTETTDKCYAVDAWWTSAGDRSSTATFIGYNGGGSETGRATVNQQANASRWNSLGTWAFSAGRNQIALSRWTTAGFYVVADAVRLSPSSACTGCQFSDTDADGANDCNDACPTDAAKTAPGVCGCGVADNNADGDAFADCAETCDTDPAKTEPGVCGCGFSDVDSDGDGAADCLDTCPADAAKTAPGVCGCGTSDVDTDGDGARDCQETCDTNPGKTAPGVCGCAIPDRDITGDGVPDCVLCGDGVTTLPEQCDDGNAASGDGCSATCQSEALLLSVPTPGVAGQANTFAARGGVPGRTIQFFGSGRVGSTPLPGCPGVNLPLGGRPAILGQVPADAAGNATLSVNVPRAYAGMPLVFVAVEQGTCRVSSIQARTF